MTIQGAKNAINEIASQLEWTLAGRLGSASRVRKFRNSVQRWRITLQFSLWQSEGAATSSQHRTQPFCAVDETKHQCPRSQKSGNADR